MKMIKDIVRGVTIGIANIIPGVSGGTMMVSMGIYDEVISAVTGIFQNFKKSVKTLFPYVLGMGMGIVGLSFAIGYLFAEYPFQTAMMFIGLIFGGLPLIFQKVAGKKPSIAEIALFAIFFALIVWMQFWGEKTAQVLATDPKTMISLLLIGILAAGAMVIPGVSGSMILMSLGYYTPIIDYINALVVAFVTLDFGTVWHCMWILVPFGIGVLIGIFFITKLVEYLLKRHERITYFAILGLVLSSPIAVLGGINMGVVNAVTVLTGIIMFGSGAMIAGMLGK